MEYENMTHAKAVDAVLAAKDIEDIKLVICLMIRASVEGDPRLHADGSLHHIDTAVQRWLSTNT